MRPYNSLAIDHINAYTQKRLENAQSLIQHVCKMSNISLEKLESLQTLIQEKARICLHFHPYRLNGEFKSVLDLLVAEGFYKSQFETQISNGSLTAYKGGDRDQWENILFGQIYENHEIRLSDRPKYGGLDLLMHSDGPSPRFGSCFLVLKPEMSQYATFSYLDSYKLPQEKGTMQYFEDILASLLVECFQRSFAIGEKEIRPHQLIDKIVENLNSEKTTYQRMPKRNLDFYIETQVHTPINLKEDVDCLVADACYKRTEYETLLHQLCEKYEIELQWNWGFELVASEVPHHFRGKNMPILAEKIAENNKINAFILGKTERKYREAGLEGKELQTKLQDLKCLWHTLVYYGKTIEKV